MKYNNLIGLCILIILLAGSASAISSNYETTYVSRIVGDTTTEMKQQISNKDMDFDFATYYSGSGTGALQKQKLDIIRTQFIPKYKSITNSWRTANVQSTLKINPGDHYLILESGTSKNTMEKSQYFTPDEITEWLDYLDDDDSLIIFDSAYSGLYLTDMKSFAGTLSPHATYIAPASYSSPYFVKALLCNMGKYDTIGEVFRQARNNYYWNTKNQLEYIGLTLLSYSLFGMPTSNAIIDKYDTAQRNMYCKDFDEKFDTQGFGTGNMQITSTSSGVYTKNFEFNITSYNVRSYDNFSIIETDKTENRYYPDELVLPVRALTVEFPLKTIVQNFSYSLEDPVELTAENLSMWNGLELVERECYRNATNASVEFSHVFTNEEELVMVIINPAEVTDCNNGKIKLYRTVKYQIDYVPYSPIIINSVEYPEEILPGQRFNATINIENIQNAPVDGEFHIRQGKELVSKMPIRTTKNSFNLEIIAPAEDGVYDYRAEFIYGNSSRAYSDFSLAVKILDAELITPELIGASGKLELIINSQLSDSFSTKIQYSIIKDGQEKSSNTKNTTINPGENKIELPVSGLSRDDIFYEVLVNIPYLNTNKVVTGTLIMNHAPVILTGNQIISENETFVLVPELIDIDNDEVSLNVDSPFAVDGYKTSFEESGEYIITIEADDGYIEIIKEISLQIDNVNRPPTIFSMDTITIKENETFTIEPNATDPDNMNSVNNDDNNLTFYYASLFDENGTWTPEFDESGNYTVQATVTDGEYYDDTFATIVVLNTNRAPVINVTDTMTVDEGDLITMDMLAYDPDNKNNVTNDDNELTVQVTAPLDENATWQTTDEDSGNYTITIVVSDGEYNTTKDVTIIVQNLNRAPEISGLADIAVQEGDLITLSPIITDLDNLNNVTNDDNQITITYPEPFASNGTWQTGYEDSGEYNITVLVSDGIIETTQNILVAVGNVNRMPSIDALQDINTTEGQTITITPTIRDPDNENSVTNDDNQLTVTYSEIIPTEGTLELDYESSGEYTIIATVSDGDLEATTSFRLKIDNVNRAPEVNVQNLHVQEGATIDYTVLIFDPDNENNVTNDNNNLITYLPPQFKDGIWAISYEESGEYDFNVWAYDGEFNTSETITITVDNVNRAPTLEEINDITAYEGETIQINAVYGDIDNENSVTNDDNNLRIEYSPPLDNQGRWVTNFFSAGTYDLAITVSDGHERIVERFAIIVNNQNRLPSIESYEPETTITINEGESQTFTVNVNDPDMETLDLTWYLDGEQVGTEEEYDYTPSHTDEGTHEIKVIAQDSEEGNAEHTWTVHVDNINRAPEVQEIGTLKIPEGDEAIITVEAEDADGDELTYSIDDERFTQNNNVFTWQTTFQDFGTFDVEITVSDGEEDVKQTIKIIVANFNHAPQILDYTPKHTKYIPHNKDFVFGITPFDSDNETLTIAWYVDGEIAGSGESFTFNAEGELKEFKIEAKVTDGNTTAEQEFNVESVDRPILEGFDEETTDIADYSEEELTSISGFTLQKGLAKIKFLEDVDLSGTTDLENNLLLQNDQIALNTPELPALNKKARLTFYNVQFTQNPVIYYAQGFATDADDICPPNICYDVTYENNVLSFTVAHFTTYIIRETPFKQYHLQIPQKIVIDAGESISEDFAIRNTGLHDLEDLEITGMFNTGSFTITPSKLDLEKGEIETIEIQGITTRPSKSGRTEIGYITLKNKDITETIPVYTELKEKLNIERLEINVGDKAYSNVDDKDKIKVKPGSHIELEFAVENSFEEKITIEDVVITAEIDDDYDESDEFDISSGNYKTKILELDLPKLLDENRYDLTITVDGEDEKGTEYEIEWTIKLKVDREKHDTQIEDLELNSAELKCKKETRLLFNLLNYGTADEEGLKIEILNKELDMDIQDYVDIQEASETEFRYRIIFDDYQKAKQYTIPVNIYYDDGQLADSKEVMLNVLSCGAKTTTENSETQIKVQTTTKLDNSRPVLKNKGDDTFTLTAMLLVLLALLLMLAGLLLLKAIY